MSIFSAFKSAIVETLKANAALAALVGDRVFDVPPMNANGVPSASVPFIYCGPMGYMRAETGYGASYTARLRLYCVTTEVGREAAWDLGDLVHKALDLERLDLAGGHVASELRIMAGGDVVNPLAPKEVFVDLQTLLISADEPYPA